MRDPGASRAIPKTAPPSYRYFIDMVERLHKVRPEDLTENSVLLGSPARITETLKKVEAAGFDEVILYFNVGLKPHAQVKDEMDRFMREVAPQFDGQHKHRAPPDRAANGVRVICARRRASRANLPVRQSSRQEPRASPITRLSRRYRRNSMTESQASRRDLARHPRPRSPPAPRFPMPGDRAGQARSRSA